MNIAIIPSADLSYNSGSIIYAKNLFNYLHKNNHKAYLVGSKLPKDIEPEYLKYITIDKKILEHPIIDDRPISDIDYSESIAGVVKYLLELHKKVGLDIIHAHYGSFTSFAAFLVNGLTGVPYIISSFGRDINIGYEKDKRIKWLIEKSFLDAKTIIISENTLKEKILEIIGDNKSEKIKEIAMPFDKNIYKDGNLKLNKNIPLISTINSCFSSEKGIEVIIDGFAEVIKEIDCQLIIAGQDDHPEQVHKKKLIKKVHDLGLQEKIIFIGFLERADVGELLRNSLFLIDARLKGNFSSVILEAMFSETPVIASNTEAARKIICHEYNGLLFTNNNSNDLKNKIVELLKNEELKNNINNNIKKWNNDNSKRYLEESCFQKVEAIYNEVIREGVK